jgi:hypothetical protein
VVGWDCGDKPRNDMDRRILDVFGILGDLCEYRSPAGLTSFSDRPMQRSQQGPARMQTKATTLYPFVPSGPDFRLALAFFAELGFEAAWERDGYAGLRWGGAYSYCRMPTCRSGRRTKWW